MRTEQSEVLVRGVEPAQVRLALPPIDRLPSRPDRPDALAEFVRSRIRGWGGVPVPLSGPLVGALWTLLVLNLFLGAWLLAVRSGSAPCSGVLCWAATLGDHLVTALMLSVVSTAALAVSVPMTRGLSRAGGPQLGLIVLGVLAGILALAGLVAVLAAVVLGLVVVVGIVAVAAEHV